MIAAGRVKGLFGADGEVSLVVYDFFLDHYRESDAHILKEPVFVVIDGLRVPLFFNSFKPRGVRGAVARFADIDTVTRAEELVGLEFFVPSSSGGSDFCSSSVIPSERGDNGFTDGFVGWTAELAVVDYFDDSVVRGTGDEPDRRIGEIVGFIDGPNPLFEVTVDDRSADPGTVLIPAGLVVEVDESARRIVFELPDGLLDLN